MENQQRGLPPESESNYLSETRTMLAGLRTGFAIAGSGALVSQLLLNRWPHWVAILVSTPFVFIGCIPMWVAVYRQHMLRKRARDSGLEIEQPTRFYLPIVLALQALIVVVLVLLTVRH